MLKKLKFIFSDFTLHIDSATLIFNEDGRLHLKTKVRGFSECDKRSQGNRPTSHPGNTMVGITAARGYILVLGPEESVADGFTECDDKADGGHLAHCVLGKVAITS